VDELCELGRDETFGTIAVAPPHHHCVPLASSHRAAASGALTRRGSRALGCCAEWVPKWGVLGRHESAFRSSGWWSR